MVLLETVQVSTFLTISFMTHANLFAKTLVKIFNSALSRAIGLNLSILSPLLGASGATTYSQLV